MTGRPPTGQVRTAARSSTTDILEVAEKGS